MGTNATCACLFLLVGLPALASAQARGELNGRVIDGTTGEPVAQVNVVLRPVAESGRTFRATTGSDGAFRMRNIPAASYVADSERSGYAARQDTVAIRPDEITTVEIKLEVVPLVVDSVAAAADRSESQALGGFWQRRKRGVGHFITRDDIEKRRPHRVIDLFPGIPGAIIKRPTSSNAAATVSFGRQGCPAAIFVNGAPFVSPTGLAEFHPDDIEAIEVYSGPSRLPAQFNQTGSRGVRPECGVIVVWTRTR